MSCNVRPWGLLPHTALVRVFKFLGRMDRYSAALVCRDWAAGFASPELWKRVIFKIRDTDLVEDIEKVEEFVTRYSSVVKNMGLEFRGERCRNLREACCRLAHLFELLSSFNTQLLQLKIRGLWFHRPLHPLPSLYSEAALSAAEAFLSSQRLLRQLEITDAFMKADPGLKLLRAVMDARLEVLDVTNFFQVDALIYDRQEFRNILKRLEYLETLKLNYRCLSKDVLEVFYKSTRRNFKSLTVMCHRDEPRGHTLSDHAWKKLRKSCSNIKVYFEITEIVDYVAFRQLVLHSIPIFSYIGTAGYTLRTLEQVERSPTDGAAIIRYLGSSFYTSLERVCLDFGFLRISNLESAVHYLCKICPRLTRLMLEGVLPSRLAESICVLMQHGKTALQDLEITFHFVTLEDSLEITRVEEVYGHLLQKKKLLFQFNLLPPL